MVVRSGADRRSKSGASAPGRMSVDAAGWSVITELSKQNGRRFTQSRERAVRVCRTQAPRSSLQVSDGWWDSVAHAARPRRYERCCGRRVRALRVLAVAVGLVAVLPSRPMPVTAAPGWPTKLDAALAARAGHAGRSRIIVRTATLDDGGRLSARMR